MLDTRTLRAMGKLLARQARSRAQEAGVEANEIIDLAPLLKPWQPGEHDAEEVVTEAGSPFRCKQEHDSTDNPMWTPSATPALFAPYHATDAAHALPWQAPTGAQDAYQDGEWMVWTDGKTYRCRENGTVWGPDVRQEAWETDE